MSPLAITIGEGALDFYAAKKDVCARVGIAHTAIDVRFQQLSEENCFSCLQSSLTVDPTRSA